MAHFGLKINKTESPDKTPYTVYYPHRKPVEERVWDQEWLQVVSIDPAKKNYALRVERRYHNGWIRPVVFDKVSIESTETVDNVTTCKTYDRLTDFLDTYQEYFLGCHYIIVERQLPQNYKATRIAQHTIAYFSFLLRNTPLLPAIVEVDPKLKGQMLGAAKGLNDTQLKGFAVEKARQMLELRQDDFSLKVLDRFRSKQDDLSDTVCQIEALFMLWGYPRTGAPPGRSGGAELEQQAATVLSAVELPTAAKQRSDLMEFLGSSGSPGPKLKLVDASPTIRLRISRPAPSVSVIAAPASFVPVPVMPTRAPAKPRRRG